MNPELIKTSRRACPSCGLKQGYFMESIKFVLPEDHPMESGYDVLVCTKCATGFADTTVTDEQLTAYYSSLAKYQDKMVGTGGGTNKYDHARLQQTAEAIAAHIKDKNARILDIGCANGGLLESLQKLGFKNIYGIDPSPTCANEVQNRLRISCITGGTADIGRFEKKFDLIIYSHVLEHLLNPRAALDKMRVSLNEGGRLYLEVPDASRFYLYESTPFQEFNTEHINYFIARTLRQVAESTGFSTEVVDQKTYKMSETLDYPAILGIWQKKESSGDFEFSFNEDLFFFLKRYATDSASQMKAIETLLERELPKDYAIWGAGQFCYKLLTLNACLKNPPRQILDNNSTNWGRKIANLEIQKGELLDPKIVTIVIASLINSAPIAHQLKALRPDIRIIDLTMAAR